MRAALANTGSPDTTPRETPPMAVEMHDIVKRFPGVVANDGIDLLVERGEVHALLGENGAGKSTLMNILFGLYHQDEGEVRIAGQPVRFHGPRDAVNAGLGMVHQHFMLIPRFTVTENVILGMEGPGALRLDRQSAERRVAELGEAYGLRVDPRARIADLPVGMQQRVEILRALYQGGRTLILDEPTALLTPQEVEELYLILRRLTDAGGTIIFITHKLREVAAISDRVTVIRRGKTVGTRQTADTTARELAELMVGREILLRVNRSLARPGEPILIADNLTVQNANGLALDRLSLNVRQGEIVGIAGVEGNGQTELVEALAGLRHPDQGKILLKGKDITGADPHQMRIAGLSYIPEDRHGRGLVLDFSLTENVLLGNADDVPFSRRGRIDYSAAEVITQQVMTEFDVRAPSPATPASSLSGGNQQKLVIGRELQREPDLLLAVQPTRGLDVGAVEFVHRQLVAERDQGRGVLLISFDLDEILDLSDRILVMFNGRIAGEYESGRVDRAELGFCMGGRTDEESTLVA